MNVHFKVEGLSCSPDYIMRTNKEIIDTIIKNFDFKCKREKLSPQEIVKFDIQKVDDKTTVEVIGEDIKEEV